MNHFYTKSIFLRVFALRSVCVFPELFTGSQIPRKNVSPGIKSMRTKLLLPVWLTARPEMVLLFSENILFSLFVVGFLDEVY